MLSDIEQLVLPPPSLTRRDTQVSGEEREAAEVCADDDWCRCGSPRNHDNHTNHTKGPEANFIFWYEQWLGVLTQQMEQQSALQTIKI